MCCYKKLHFGVLDKKFVQEIRNWFQENDMESLIGLNNILGSRKHTEVDLMFICCNYGFTKEK